jgi:hypothetical protein
VSQLIDEFRLAEGVLVDGFQSHVEVQLFLVLSEVVRQV